MIRFRGRSHSHPLLLLACVILPTVAGCDEASVEDHVLRVDATGVVQGVVFFDQNGSESPDPTDGLLPDIGVWLVQARGGPPVATDVTDGEGVFVMPEVPVGTYRLSVDPAAIPDSIEILGLDDETFVLSVDDTVTQGVRASFPTVALSEVADLPPSVRIFTTGIALNPRDPAGDGAVHLQEGEAYLRATNVSEASISAGDSVRFRGRTALEAGRIVLDDVTAFVLLQGAQNPTPVEAESGTAAGADQGSLDAALVRIGEAEILDTASVPEGLSVTVDDGSGPIDLLVRSYLPFDLEPLDPGFAKVVQATGLLVKKASTQEDEWRLLPRIQGDLVVEPFPLMDVADIWGLPADLSVTADGIVLNPVSQPTPGTIHIRDEGVHLRVQNVEGVSPLPGDSVRVRGHTLRSLGRTLLDAELVTVLSAGSSVPQPAEVTTDAAASAGGGGRQLDAGLVRVASAEVVDTTTVAGEFIVTVDDGSGALDIVVTPSVDVETGIFEPGTTVLDTATGLLVPHRGIDGVLRWRLLPRFADDLVVQ